MMLVSYCIKKALQDETLFQHVDAWAISS
jgi:hypothetical protein